MRKINFIRTENFGETKMNKYGYAWGVLGFLSGTQVAEGSVFLGFVFAAAGLVCLLMASTKGSD